jgi:tRNA(Ile)-lysidine synthase
MGSSAKRSNLKIEKQVLRTVKDTIARYAMFDQGDRVLVAVSGGSDSAALVHILHTIAGDFSLKLAVAHLNHSLRGQESERDVAFVAGLAKKLDLAFFNDKRDVKAFQRRRRLSLEEAARRVRYEFFDDIAANQGFDKVALGHHSNDNAELVLMNLLRGSGPLGLTGIAAVRDSKIVRPLIHLKHAEILAYVSAKNLTFVTDTSNMDPVHRRNQIRHYLIPELKKSYNPAIVDSLNRLGEILQAEDQWMDQTLEPLYAETISDHGADGIRVDLSAITLHPAVGRRIIRKAIWRVKQDLRRITFAHVEAVMDLAARSCSSGCLDLPDGIRVIREATVLRIKKEDQKSRVPKIDYHYTITAEGTTVIKEANIVLKLKEIDIEDVPDFKDAARTRAFLDRDRLQFPLMVRNFLPGDRFSPLGLNGSQKLKKFFINNKIPVHRRKSCPLLLSGDKIIWVGGLRIDNSVKLGPKTQRVLMAELLLAQ